MLDMMIVAALALAPPRGARLMTVVSKGAQVCTYDRESTNTSGDEKTCEAVRGADNQGRLTLTIRVRGKVVATVVVLEASDEWSSVTINGRPGMGYKEDGKIDHFSTLDLDETIDVGD